MGMRLEAVLFDLDNTLLLFDESRYFERYMELLSHEFGDLMSPRDFYTRIFDATKALLENNGQMLNIDYFRKLFAEGFGSDADEIWGRFATFYERDFGELKEFVFLPDGGSDVIHDLKAKNLKLVIATNPILPLSLQQKRIDWAQLGNFEFDLITHIGNMSYCKPQLGYYQEICQKVGVEPSSCIMVGNDPVNDMVVSRLGMLTYLTTDSISVDRSSLRLSRQILADIPEEMVQPDYKGPLKDVSRIINSLI
jgi:FMN phosphatase YigB (HAD superfamily)